jgi:hypothetical protein
MSLVLTVDWSLLTEFAAKFTVDVRGYTAAEEDMLCLQLKIDFMKRPFFRFN